jgi:hypothetical protein
MDLNALREIMENGMRMAAAEAAPNEGGYSGTSLGLFAKEAHEVAKTTSAALNDADPLSDGDQSSLNKFWPGTKSQSLIDIWCSGLSFGYLIRNADINGGWVESGASLLEIAQALSVPAFPHLALAVAASRGNADRVAALLKPLSGEALRDVLERRVTPLRLSPLLLACAGSRCIGKLNHLSPEDEAMADYIRVVTLLLRAGARVDAKDVLGMTPWHHCLTSMFSRTSLEVAQFLLRGNHGGAGVLDVNARSRGGRTALIEVSMDLTGSKLPAAILALEAGTDPTISENDGFSPLRNISHIVNQKLHDVMGSAEKRKRTGTGRTLEGARVRLEGLKTTALNDREGLCGVLDCFKGRYAVLLDGDTVPLAILTANVCEAGARNTTCASCGKSAANNSACTRCLAVFYCDKKCQKEHWPQHKLKCISKEAALSGREWVPRPKGDVGGIQRFSSFGPKNSTIEMWQMRGITENVMLKVQAPLVEGGGGNLMAYDEKRIFIGEFEQSAVPILTALIKKQRIPKVYVSAERGVVNGIEGIYIRSDAALPPPMW